MWYKVLVKSQMDLQGTLTFYDICITPASEKYDIYQIEPDFKVYNSRYCISLQNIFNMPQGGMSEA
jgi:hypothetical protein